MKLGRLFGKKMSSRTVLHYRHLAGILIKKINYFFIHYNFLIYFKGFNYRRAKTRPIELTDKQKLERYLWALNNINQNFENVVFLDETSIQTH